ncbi:MAG: hypothetical protein HUJ98_00995 [Bacteroidaceae bacterium]|nr:hypothetical protein [Bacteroidaceae bacterium]
MTLKLISDAMASKQLPYSFGTFNSDVASIQQWWVGEYIEVEPMNEDGQQECTFILTGTSKGSWLSLEESKQKIQELFPSIDGKVAILNNGSAVAIFYASASLLPTMDVDMKRMQVNLKIKEWKVN